MEECFSNAALSVWQSTVSDVENRKSIIVGAPPSNLKTVKGPSGSLLQQATAVAAKENAAQQGAHLLAGAMPGRQVADCAQVAFNLAKARIDGRSSDVLAFEQEFQKYGNCDGRWLECVDQYLANYQLAQRHVPYRKWQNLGDFVLESNAASPAAIDPLPMQCKIGIIGDWGTGEPRAQNLLRKLATHNVQLLIHIGDIYYSCTQAEADQFLQNCQSAFDGYPPRILSLCGNHDLYAGGQPYYDLLDKIGQPASFFCVRNKDWQLVAADTAIHDHKPWGIDNAEPWVQDRDNGTDYSEMDWHRNKLGQPVGRTILFSHHQPFSYNSPIAGGPVNEKLFQQFAPFQNQIAAWLWGHEHNQVLYKPFGWLARGRCVGASAIPVPSVTGLYNPNPSFEESDNSPSPSIPALLLPAQEMLTVDQALGLYNLGYAVITLDGPKGQIEYFDYNSSADAARSMYRESL